MRVVYLHQYFRTPAMSGGTRSYELARRLVQRGHTVDLVTADSQAEPCAPRWRVSDEAGIRVHWLRSAYSNRMSYADRVRAFALFAVAASGRAAMLDADVVFASSTPLTVAIPAMVAGTLRGRPVVFEIRDRWPALPIAIGALRGAGPIWATRALERAAYLAATSVIALSPGMSAGVVREGTPAEKVSVIPNVSDICRFQVPSDAGQRLRQQDRWLGERPLVLYAGTLGRMNDVGYLVQVAAAMRALSSDVRFLILGEGAEEEQLREQARALGVLGRNLQVRPPVAKEDVPAFFSAATIATSLFADVPEMTENSANKFFDALAAGRPIAINYGGWQSDLLQRWGVGVVLPRDPVIAAQELASRLADKRWLTEAGSCALELGKAEFSADRAFAKLEAVLAAALDPSIK
ncbi:MAG: glycosyltransferase family 4 protein [Thermoanaerobaculia bacterium]